MSTTYLCASLPGDLSLSIIALVDLVLLASGLACEAHVLASPCVLRTRKVCRGLSVDKTQSEGSSSNGRAPDGLAGALHSMTSTLIVSTARSLSSPPLAPLSPFSASLPQEVAPQQSFLPLLLVQGASAMHKARTHSVHGDDTQGTAAKTLNWLCQWFVHAMPA